GTDMQAVTVTITGTNDLPTVNAVTPQTVDEDLLTDAAPDTFVSDSLNITWAADDYSRTDPAVVDVRVVFTGASSSAGAGSDILGTSRGETIGFFISEDGDTI